MNGSMQALLDHLDSIINDAEELQTMTFDIKDSGERTTFASGMVRDTTAGKTDWHRVADGPMLRRWAEHLTKGKAKYDDIKPGVPNWTLGNGVEEYERFRQSAFRHFMAWFHGEHAEDHGAAVFFNINGAEFVRERLGGEYVAADDVPF